MGGFDKVECWKCKFFASLRAALRCLATRFRYCRGSKMNCENASSRLSIFPSFSDANACCSTVRHTPDHDDVADFGIVLHKCGMLEYCDGS